MGDHAGILSAVVHFLIHSSLFHSVLFYHIFFFSRGKKNLTKSLLKWWTLRLTPQVHLVTFWAPEWSILYCGGMKQCHWNKQVEKSGCKKAATQGYSFCMVQWYCCIQGMAHPSVPCLFPQARGPYGGPWWQERGWWEKRGLMGWGSSGQAWCYLDWIEFLKTVDWTFSESLWALSFNLSFLSLLKGRESPIQFSEYIWCLWYSQHSRVFKDLYQFPWFSDSSMTPMNFLSSLWIFDFLMTLMIFWLFWTLYEFSTFLWFQWFSEFFGLSMSFRLFNDFNDFNDFLIFFELSLSFSHFDYKNIFRDFSHLPFAPFWVLPVSWHIHMFSARCALLFQFYSPECPNSESHCSTILVAL